MKQGSHHSAETIAKITAAMSTPEARARAAWNRTGENNPLWGIGSMQGRHPSLETRAKIGASVSAAIKGDHNPNWRDGISRLPYSWTFNAVLKEEIRRRDGHKCQLCGVPQAECRRKLDVHHADYNKENSDPANLTALCVSCNSKVNGNREHWTAFFQAKAKKCEIAGKDN